MLHKTSTYVKSYDCKTKWIYSSIEDKELLKKHDDIWNKVTHSIKNI